MSVRLKPATLSDAEAMHRLQVAAFAPMLAKYRDHAISPAAETVHRVREKIAMADSRYYFIIAEGSVVGGIRVKRSGGRKVISPLFICVECRGRGYAQQAIAAAEALYGADRWALDTIAEEPGNCHLYEKMGYHRVGIPQRVRPNMTIVDYEKD